MRTHNTQPLQPLALPTPRPPCALCPALQAIRRPLHYALVDEVDSILIGAWRMWECVIVGVVVGVWAPPLPLRAAASLQSCARTVLCCLFPPADEAANPYIITTPMAASHLQADKFRAAIEVSSLAACLAGWPAVLLGRGQRGVQV